MAHTFSPNLDSDLEYEYRWRLAKLFDYIEFLGVSHWGENPALSLPALYVPLRLTDRPIGAKSVETESIFIGEALENNRHIVVLGDPGSGKSTLIKLLAYSFACPDPTPLGQRLGAHIPIPIILKDYDVRSWLCYQDMLRDFIARQMPAEVRGRITVDWLETAIKTGRAIVLLDGLDEVGDKSTRTDLRNNVIFPLLWNAPKSLVVSTSRIVGYDEAPISDMFKVSGQELNKWLQSFASDEEVLLSKDVDVTIGGSVRIEAKSYYIAPFDDEGINDFARRWYGLRELDIVRCEENITAFLSAIRQNERTRILAASPRLLTMMALIYRIGADLPSGRIKLYDKIVETYLITLQDYKKIGRFGAGLDEMKRWLAAIGRDMQEGRTNNHKNENNEHSEILISEKDILTSLAKAISKDRPHANANAEARSFLDYAVRRGGLLLPRGQSNGSELFAFIHLTFQEYFAAYAIRQEYWDFQKLFSEFNSLVNSVAAWATDTRWHETLLLLFEMFSEMSGLADRIVESLVPTENINTWILIAGLLGDSDSGLTERVRSSLLEELMIKLCSSGNVGLLPSVKMLSELYSEVNNWFEDGFNRAPVENEFFFFHFALEILSGNNHFANEIDSNSKLNYYRGEFVKYFSKFRDNDWNDIQVEAVMLWIGDFEGVNAWALQRISMRYWFLDWNSEGPSFIPSLSNVYLRRIVKDQNENSLLAILASAYYLFRLRFFLLISVYNIKSMDSWMTKNVLKMYRSQAPSMSWIMLKSMSQLRAWIIHNRMPFTVPIYLSQSLSDGYNDFYIESSGYEGFLANILYESGRIFRNPLEKSTKDDIVADLRLLSKPGNDEFTRLCAFTALMSLGDFDPNMCRMMNDLLDKAVDEDGDFKFPESLKEEVEKLLSSNDRRIIFQHIWLHEKGKPLFVPEDFSHKGNDTAHQSYILCAPPEKLFPRIALQIGGNLRKRCEELGLTP